VWLVCTAFAAPPPYRGTVRFGRVPLPGATVTVTQGGKTLSTVTDQAGTYAFDDLAYGVWTINIEMQCFETIRADVTIAPNMTTGAWEMKFLPASRLTANAQAFKAIQESPPALSPAPAKEPERKPAATEQEDSQNAAPMEVNEQSADGFLVQGSVNNAATSVYATNPAFGNTRTGSKGLYTGGLWVVEGNSALNARPFSLSGIEAAKPAYNNFTGGAILEGPVKIPHLMPRGPNFEVQYQWTRSSSAIAQTALVPTQAQRGGDLSGLVSALGQPVTVRDPVTGRQYAGNQVPVSAQAKSLLALYPLPNIASVSNYNYQNSVIDNSHQDVLQFRLDKVIGRKDGVYGNFNLERTRSDDVNLFGFVDRANTQGVNADAHWMHWLEPHVYVFANYAFSRLRTRKVPHFANRMNVSGMAGIYGNDQDATDWGPPSLGFSSGFAGLSDGNSAFNRNRTDSLTASAFTNSGKHNITIGGELRKQQYNVLSQQNPRGAFEFTGSASGSDLGDFLIGVPDTSSIAFGNADKYFRQTAYSLYFTDDWRVRPGLTINAGMRWDYSTPMTELKGRLANLDTASGFTAVAPVLGSDPVGAVNGQHYPSSLIWPDKTMFQPRIGISWRPVPASTVVIRAGYGIYPNTSVYQNIVLQMAQQASLPNSISFSVQNNASCRLSMATFVLPQQCKTGVAGTFGIDPNFRVGYAQTWSLGVQRNMPFAMQMTVTYLGTKGTHGAQQILPNSYPPGGANPCPNCPSGFIYESSGGNSIRHAGQLKLRRRLRSGLAASLVYTYAKSIDDAAYLAGPGSVASGGLAQPAAAVAQNWLNPRAERSLSSFDQRNLLSAQVQYTSGHGLGGWTLLEGRLGRALKEWSVTSTMSYGSGTPETPLYAAAVPGTGFTGIIRPDLTGAPTSSASGTAHLNAAAFKTPEAGQWGTAARNSITGPGQVTLNSQLARTFRPYGKLYLDVAVNATNVLNHPTFTSWNNYVTNAQFGQPVSPRAMRNLQTVFRLRF